MKTFRFLCFCLFTLVYSSAQAAVPVDAEELKAYEYDIIIKTIESVNKAVTSDGIIKKYQLHMPILPPRLDEQQVAALVNKEIDAQVEARYPKTQFKQIEIESRHKFRMYKVGDLVTMRVVDPRRKVSMTLTRHIRQIVSGKGVRLGDTFFIFRDIDRDEYPHFFKVQHDRAVEREIDRQRNYYTTLRRNFEKETRMKLTKEIWRSEGYVYRKKTQKWMPREMVFQYRYDKDWMKKFKEIRPDVEITEFEAVGFTWNEALERYERPGKAGEDAPKTGTGDATAATTGLKPKKNVSDSLKNWSKLVSEIFSQGDSKEDVWDEDEKGEGEKKKEEKKEE